MIVVRTIRFKNRLIRQPPEITALETEAPKMEAPEADAQEAEATETEVPLDSGVLGARRKRKRPTKPKKAKKPKKAAKKAKGAALLSCLVPLQLVCHLPDGLGPVVVYENDLCNSALGGE